VCLVWMNLRTGGRVSRGSPIGEQPIHRDGHIISVFPIVPQSGAGSLRPPLVMGSQAVDPFPVVKEWGTVAREHKSHIYLTEPDKALKVVAKGFARSSRNWTPAVIWSPDIRETATCFIEAAVTDGVAGRHKAGELITALCDDVTVGNVTKGPGASWSEVVSIELSNQIHWVFLWETQHLKEGAHLLLDLSRGDPLNEFGFRPAYVYSGCSTEEPGNGAEMIEIVMGNKQIRAFKIQAKFCRSPSP